MPIDWSQLRGLAIRELISALIRDGFYLRNQRGSHQRYRHPNGRRVTVSFHHPGDTLRPKTLKRIIEDQAKWTEEDLKRLGFLSNMARSKSLIPTRIREHEFVSFTLWVKAARFDFTDSRLS